MTLGAVPTTPRRLLVRMPNWIGDGVMATPAVLDLAAALPDWEISLQAVGRTWGLWGGLDYPFALLPVLPERPGRSRTTLAVVHSLRGQRFDVALVLPPSFSSALLAALARIPIRIGWPSEARGALLTDRVPRPTRERHLRDQYQELVAATIERLGGGSVVLPEAANLRVPVAALELVSAAEWWSKSGLDPGRTIALAPGATYGETKRWPSPRFAGLARRLLGNGWHVLWIGGPDERVLADSLAAQVQGDHGGDGGGRSISVAGQWNLAQTLSRLVRVRAVVANDSGALHLAQAAGTPVIAIFGSTAPGWTGPRGVAQRVIYDGISCSPCFSRSCPTAIECLTGIDGERVWQIVSRLVGERDRPSASGPPAVFLDRDGTILEPVPYLREAREVRLLPGSSGALRALQTAGYRLVVITNQSAVARGIIDRRQLRAIHARMEALLAAEGVILSGIEICPHHPDFTGPCACRKPAPGMLQAAAHRLGIDLARSYLIGDARSDLAAARNAGVQPLLVRTGYGRETEASGAGGAVFDSVVEASGWLVSLQK